MLLAIEQFSPNNSNCMGSIVQLLKLFHSNRVKSFCMMDEKQKFSNIFQFSNNFFFIVAQSLSREIFRREWIKIREKGNHICA